MGEQDERTERKSPRAAAALSLSLSPSILRGISLPKIQEFLIYEYFYLDFNTFLYVYFT